MCRHCRECATIKFRHRTLGAEHSPSQSWGDPRNDGFDLVAMYPKPQPLAAPEHVAEDIAQDFIEAMSSLRMQNYTSAGMMFRKVLQRATTRLAPAGVDFHRTTLQVRINLLADRHLVTRAMREWAHIIRLDGNEAVHEEDETFTPQQAAQMRDFTEVFLLYAFTLPARVEALSRQARPRCLIFLSTQTNS